MITGAVDDRRAAEAGWAAHLYPRGGLGGNVDVGPSIGGELQPEISAGGSAVSAHDNPVWTPASRAARWDDYHHGTARSQGGESDTQDFLLQNSTIKAFQYTESMHAV